MIKLFQLLFKALKAFKKLFKGKKGIKVGSQGAKSLIKGVVQESIGGIDIYSKLRPKKVVEEKPKKVKEYAVMKMWKSLSKAQQQQFREWFRTKAMSQSRVARSFTFENELRRINRRVKQISTKYFIEKKKLTQAEWKFIEFYSEFFGDISYTKGGKQVLRKHKLKVPWEKGNSFILRYRYLGEANGKAKGNLQTIMKRGKAIYNFPNFPYVEYVMLKNVNGNIGKYWWDKWLWKYSTSSSRYRKFAFKGRVKQFEEFLARR